jgi:hypothetical protein
MAMQIVWPLPNEMGTLSLDVKHGNRVNDQKEVLELEFTVRGPARRHFSYERLVWCRTS